jgi:ubiquinone/menaquinone biosynthesis C-methylase UbiE
MGFYERHIAPVLISCACSAKPIGRQREKVVPLAYGEVLELGMGAGANLPYYDRSKVANVSAVEPNAQMRSRAAKAAAEAGIEIKLLDGVGERLPYEDRSFDCVVCTYTLCTVGDVGKTLGELRRVLKPEGRLLYCEHGRAPDAEVERWQRRIEPIWTPLGGGCRLTRTPGKSIREHGFAVEWQDQFYLPNTPRSFGWTEWGAASVA